MDINSDLEKFLRLNSKFSQVSTDQNRLHFSSLFNSVAVLQVTHISSKETRMSAERSRKKNPETR